MKTTILQPGENIHVIHRRRFEKDIRRHFVGRVDGRKLWVTDGNDWKRDVKEFGWG